MAKVVICPSCQYQGSIPDEVQAKRIRCPKCKESFDVAAATQAGAGSGKPPAAPKKRPPAAAKTAFDDLDSVQPLPTLSGPSTRRSPAIAARAGGGSGPSPMLYAALGVGGLAVVLLGVVLAVFLTRGNGEPPARVNKESDVAQNDAPARSQSRSAAVENVAALTQEASGATAASPVGNTYATPNVPPVVEGAEIMRRLKDATVYLKHKIAGRTLASGTGFVIEIRGDTVILATNRHVAVFDESEVPPSLAPKGSKLEFEAVFRSGEGPQKEQALPAQIVAADTSGDFQNDLAILMVKGVKKPPAPISVSARSETTEGMAYAAAGFPFGGMLNSTPNQGNPTVTTPFGHISRLIRDKDGQLELFQVDGSLQPGNSGGPIIEEKTGKLIGLAVAKLGSVDTIGLVIPADELRRMLAGRVGALDLTLKTLNQTNANLEIKAEILDPKGTVKTVLVHAAPASAGTISPNADGTYPPLPNTKGVELQRDPKVPTASGQVEVALSGQGAAARKILLQTAHRDARGQLVYSKPREIELPEKPGRIAMSTELARILKTIQRKSFSMLPALVDPEKDCKLVKSDDDMKIKIEIPGGKVRSLAPYIVQRLNKKRALHNAPMSLIDVEGDFAVLVEVTGEITAGATLPKDRQGNMIPFTFQAAGLVLYQDKDNFVRLERSAGVDVNSLQPVHKVLFEVVKDGQLVPNQNYPAVPEGPVYLLLIRRKGRVMCGASPNLGSPPQPFKLIELDLPKKVRVGLSASNISAKPYAAQFENFALISNETQLDAMFSEPPPPEKKE